MHRQLKLRRGIAAGIGVTGVFLLAATALTILLSVLVRQLSGLTDSLYDTLDTLQHVMENVPKNAEAAAMYYHDSVVPGMNALRSQADALETLTDKSCWPYPTYSDLLFY